MKTVVQTSGADIMPVYRYRLNLGGQEEIKLEGITFIKGQSIEYTEDQYDLNKYVPSHLDKWIDGVLHNSENPVHFDETYQDIQNVKEILEAADLLVGIDAPNATTQELTDGTVTDARLFSPAQIKAAAETHGGVNNKVQIITSPQITVSHDLSLGNIVDVTDNLAAGTLTIPAPTLPTNVAKGDKFVYLFHKLQATTCVISFVATPSNLIYQFKNGTDARVEFEYNGYKLIVVGYVNQSAISITNITQTATESLITTALTKSNGSSIPFDLNTSEEIVWQSFVNIARLPTGTLAADGTITLDTAMTYYNPAHYFGYCVGWLPASAHTGGYDGWFWMKMTSGTAGVVFNKQFNQNNPRVPRNIESLPKLVGTGTAYAQGTTLRTFFKKKMPAHWMGRNGRLIVEMTYLANPASGNIKYAQFDLIGISSSTGTSGAISLAHNTFNGNNTPTRTKTVKYIITNKGVENKQTAPYVAGGDTSDGTNTPFVIFDIDTAKEIELRLSLQTNPGTDWIAVEEVKITHDRGSEINDNFYPYSLNAENVKVPATIAGMNRFRYPVGETNPVGLINIGSARLSQQPECNWNTIQIANNPTYVTDLTNPTYFNQTRVAEFESIVSNLKNNYPNIFIEWNPYGTPLFLASSAANPSYGDNVTYGPWGYLGECGYPTDIEQFRAFITAVIKHFNIPANTGAGQTASNWAYRNSGKKGIDGVSPTNEPRDGSTGTFGFATTGNGNNTGANYNPAGVGDVRFGWRTLAQEANMMTVSFEACRATDPSVKHFTPGFTDDWNYFTSLLNTTSPLTGKLVKNCYDVFEYHTYTINPAFEVLGTYDQDVIDGRGSVPYIVRKLDEIGASSENICIGEIGVGTNANSAEQIAWYAKTQQQHYEWWTRVFVGLATTGTDASGFSKVKYVMPWHWGEVGGPTYRGESGDWQSTTFGNSQALNFVNNSLAGKTITPVGVDEDGKYTIKVVSPASTTVV